MPRSPRLFQRLDGPYAANAMASIVAAVSIIFLSLESSPTPAGADIARRLINKQIVNVIAAKPELSSQPVKSEDATELTPEQQCEKELANKIALIERGLEFLARTPEYTAQFVKQELVGGNLLDEQEMEMKIRHAPFSVYLKWNTGEVGREVLYVDGVNDGRMTAHGGGWKARLPAVSLDPHGSMAMAESRYPVTKAGLTELAKAMLEVHKQDLQLKRVIRCEKLADQSFDGRPCHSYLIEYKDVKVSQQYRKSISMIDKEWSIPIYTRNFGWLNGEVPADPEEHDAATLLEFYSYANVTFRPNLVALDFDHTNEDYRFKRQ